MRGRWKSGPGNQGNREPRNRPTDTHSADIQQRSKAIWWRHLTVIDTEFQFFRMRRSGNLLHSNLNIADMTKLYSQKWLRWWILWDIYTTIKQANTLETLASWKAHIDTFLLWFLRSIPALMFFCKIPNCARWFLLSLQNLFLKSSVSTISSPIL